MIQFPQIDKDATKCCCNYCPLTITDRNGTRLISTKVENSLSNGCFHGSPSICIYAFFHDPPLSSNLIAKAWKIAVQ